MYLSRVSTLCASATDAANARVCTFNTKISRSFGIERAYWAKQKALVLKELQRLQVLYYYSTKSVWDAGIESNKLGDDPVEVGFVLNAYKTVTQINAMSVIAFLELQNLFDLESVIRFQMANEVNHRFSTMQKNYSLYLAVVETWSPI